MEVRSLWGDSESIARNVSGRHSVDGGGEAYTVDSKVIRRTSHFLRSSAKGSEPRPGGVKRSKADRRRECVKGMSRRTKALAALLYSERKAALLDCFPFAVDVSVGVDVGDGAPSCFELAFRGSCVEKGASLATVVVAVGIVEDAGGQRKVKAQTRGAASAIGFTCAGRAKYGVCDT